MADRWGRWEMLPPGQGWIYWHVLLRDYPQVRATVSEALAGIGGLDPVPYEWLHLATLVGLTGEITEEQLAALIAEAWKRLADVQPINVTLGRVLSRPEAVALEVRPAKVLAPVLDAVTSRDGRL